jgi:transposase
MGNVLDTHRQQQVVALGRLGWSLRRIERETGIRRETVSDYLKAAGIVVRGRGRPGEGKAKPAISGEVSTDLSPPRGLPPPTRAPQASACEPFRDRIEAALTRGRNAMAIWQDLVEDGFTARYASVRRFVRQLRGSPPPEARVVITTAVGEEAQVDYGDGPMVRHPQTGKFRRVRLFVLTLAYSRKAVRLLIWQSSAQTWAELHERAFRRLGGSTRVVVLDNLKEGVLTPDIYEPTLNPLYRDVLAHYGVVGLPCRVGDPDRKDQASHCSPFRTSDDSGGWQPRSRSRLPGWAVGSGPVGGSKRIVPLSSARTAWRIPAWANFLAVVGWTWRVWAI